MFIDEMVLGRGFWLGRLFGVFGGFVENENGVLKFRRLFSWLFLIVSVLVFVKWGVFFEMFFF